MAAPRRGAPGSAAHALGNHVPGVAGRARQRSGRRLRAYLRRVEGDGGKNVERAAIFDRGTPSCVRRFRGCRRPSSRSLPAWLFPIHRAGNAYRFRRVSSTCEHQGDRVVFRSDSFPLGIPAADVERPPGRGSARRTSRRTRKEASSNARAPGKQLESTATAATSCRNVVRAAACINFPCISVHCIVLDCAAVSGHLSIRAANCSGPDIRSRPAC